MKDNLDFHIIVIILRYMSEVIYLDKDNLIDYFGGNKVVAVFISETCNACNKLKPFLDKLPEEYKVVVVNSHRHLASKRYFPGGVKYYPTIALYENGYYKKELEPIEIVNKTIE